jgi:hypothetical protein
MKYRVYKGTAARLLAGIAIGAALIAVMLLFL